MEKISGIIRPNARTKAVDVSRAQPVRPGAPTWGRPEGKVTKAIEDKVTLSSVAAERPIEPVTYRNPAESTRVKVAQDLAEKFFNTKNIQNVAKDSEAPLSEEMADNASASMRSSVNPVSSREEIE